MSVQRPAPPSQEDLERRALILSNLKVKAEVEKLREETYLLKRRHKLEIYRTIISLGAILGSLTLVFEKLL